MTNPKRGRPRDTANHGTGATAARVAEKIAAKVDAKQASLDRVAEKVSAKANRLDKVAAKVAKKAEMLDLITAELGALDLWTRAEPAPRQARFTRERLAAAAIRIADTEGLDALSMRRLAVELGAGTMTLYHYVRTKDELLTLVVDEVMGEVVLGPHEPMPSEWRDAVTLIAQRTHDAVMRHPWVLDITDDPAVGPNGVRHFDQSLAAVASLELSLADKFDIVSAVDEYVFGACLWERENGGSDARPDTKVTDYVQRPRGDGGVPAARGVERGVRARRGVGADRAPSDRSGSVRPDAAPAPGRHRGRFAGFCGLDPGPSPGLPLWYPIGYHRGMSAAVTLRRARQRSGLSLRELAGRAGTSHSTVAAYEAGRKVPTVETFDRLLRAAGFELRAS